MKRFSRTPTVTIDRDRYEELLRKESVNELLIAKAAEKLTDQFVEIRQLRKELDNALAVIQDAAADLEVYAL
jgi:hypothetical protein